MFQSFGIEVNTSFYVVSTSQGVVLSNHPPTDENDCTVFLKLSLRNLQVNFKVVFKTLFVHFFAKILALLLKELETLIFHISSKNQHH